MCDWLGEPVVVGGAVEDSQLKLAASGVVLDVFKTELEDAALKKSIAGQIQPDYLWNAKVLALVRLFLRLIAFWLALDWLRLFLSL